jgi:ribonuclease HII
MSRADRVSIVALTAGTIDRVGLHRANLHALARALQGLGPAGECALVDGFDLGPEAPAHRRVVGGDRRSFAIAAAAVVAKTTRDRLMRGPAAAAHPRYGFDEHVGYATVAHRQAIVAHGACALHRRSFRSPAFDGH